MTCDGTPRPGELAEFIRQCARGQQPSHRVLNEPGWWHDMGIEPLEIAKTLWQTTHEK